MYEHEPIKPGQIWREVDPRLERYVRVIGITGGIRGVMIETVIKVGDAWQRKPRCGKTYCNPERFNGKRGGYSLVQLEN